MYRAAQRGGSAPVPGRVLAIKASAAASARFVLAWRACVAFSWLADWLAGWLTAAEHPPLTPPGPAPPPPPPPLRAQGLTPDADEADLYKLLEPVTGVKSVRLDRDPATQLCTGGGLLEFERPEGAAALLGSAWRDGTYYGASRLEFEYATG